MKTGKRWLLIDAGNSRLKWAEVVAGRVRPSPSATWSMATLPAVARRVLRAGAKADAVWVCNVAGSRVADALRTAARGAGAPPPRFLRSSAHAGGVRNAYPAPARLGVDRWLAIIAAHRLFPREPVCVVSLGTATTLDLVDARGRHRGGAIIPGATMMVRSLVQGTALIGARAAAGRQRMPALFANDTLAAITGGSLHATLAVLAHAHAEARVLLGREPRLLLTGGGVAALQRLPAARRALGSTWQVVPDLVFDGMIVLAAGATQ